MTRVIRSNVVTATGVVNVEAECRDCTWTAGRKNAMPLAKQHAARYGHAVGVEQTIAVTYFPDGHPDLASVRRR